MTDTRKVLIVEDHPLFREALVTALLRAFPTDATAFEVSSISEGLVVLSQEDISLVLMDLNVTDASGFEGLARIRAAVPSCAIYVVSATETDQAYRKARDLGANGYLPKSLSLEDLSAALATALDGGTWFPETDDIQTPTVDMSALRLQSLTPAQRRVLSGLSEGLLNKQIAFEMGISEATVKAHMTAIFRKLGANNRTQALLIYKQALTVQNDNQSSD